MKKIILTVIFILSVIFHIAAQTTDTEKKKLTFINQQVIENYKAKNFDEALVFAEQSLELAIKLFGNEHPETATSYGNLGEIYKAREKYSRASENLEKALSIYQKQNVKNLKQIAATAESLGVALVYDKKNKQAEAFLALAVEALEKLYGKESRELLPSLKNQTDYYRLTGEMDKMDALYVRRYLTARKVFGKESSELTKITEERYCATVKTLGNSDEFSNREKSFYDAIRDESEVENKKDAATIGKGVVNGTAISLPKPAYPVAARMDRAGGVYPVRVLIDEKGKVVEAESICGGHPALREASREAAAKAKFKPTLLSGQPVKVNGIIVYNFVP